jgi:hypothetical protein
MIGPPGAEYHSGRRLSGKMLGLVPWLLEMLVSKQLMTGKTNLHRLCLSQISLSFPDTGTLSKNDCHGCHRVARGFIMYHPPQTSANMSFVSFPVSCFLCLSAVSFLGCFFFWTGGTRRAVWLKLSPAVLLKLSPHAFVPCFLPLSFAGPQALAVVP